MKVTAIATDLDGTLTNRIGVLNLDALKKIRQLEKSKIPVIIVSGQNIHSARTLSYYMGASTLTVAENGGVVSYWFLKPILLGSRKPAEEALESLRKKFGDKIRTTLNAELRQRDITLQKRFNIHLAREYLKGKHDDAKLMDSGFVYHVIDITISKGAGLMEAIKLYNSQENIHAPIEIDGIISIGDANNDLDLLKATKYGIALRHAPKELKEVASFVTSKRYGKGFVEAIEHVVKEFNIELKD